MAGSGQRAKGEGTIRYDEDRDRWEGRLDVGVNAAGRRVRRKVTGATRKEVAARLAQLRQQHAQGLPVASGAMTVGQLLDRWLDDVLPAKVESGTVSSYRWAAAHLRPALGSRQLVKLTPEDVERVLVEKQGELAHSSLVRLRAVLGQAIRWAEKRGYVHRNVAALADMPAASSAERTGRAMTVDEARRFVDVIRGHRYEAMWLTQLGLGLRPGEVAALSWPDVDLDGDLVHVRSSLRWTNGTPTLVAPKTSRSRRTLAAPPAVVEALRAHRRSQAQARLAFAGAWPTEWNDLVFTTEAGTPLDPSNVRRDFRTAAAGADLDGLRPYDLRHSAASLLAAAGVPLEHVADVLGHDGLRMARLVYVHAISPAVGAAAAPMQRIIHGDAPSGG